MAKFKPFHEFQKPLIGFTPKPFPIFMRTCLDYVETVIPKDHLCRVVKLVLVKTGRGSIFTRYRRDRSQILVLIEMGIRF